MMFAAEKTFSKLFLPLFLFKKVAFLNEMC